MPDPDGDAAALDAGRLGSLVSGNPLVTRLIVLDRIDSTNDEVRRLALDRAPGGTVVVAAEQAAGRGRQGRRWHSPPGPGLYLSVLLRPERPPGEVTRWTLGAALAACLACRDETGCDVRIKWPNDLLHDGRKLGGVLAELRSAGGRTRDLVLGIGLNVRHSGLDFPPELRDSATSLHLASGRGILDRESLAARLLGRLAEICERLGRGEWTEVARDWERLAPGARGTRVSVPGGPAGGPCRGITRGLAPDGALLVETPDGAVLAVRDAESVVRVE
jgi:BirA family biotin operon repressor/biotin-[acetyl-CoA-carboxylase] ligase